MLNLGALEFTLGVNTRALDAARGRIEAFGSAVQVQQNLANRGIDNTVNQYRKVENAILKATETFNKFAAKVNSSNLSPEIKTQKIEEAGRSLNDFTKRVAEAGKAGDNTKLDRGFAQFTNRINEANRSLTPLIANEKKAAKAASDMANAASKELNSTGIQRFNAFLGETSVRWQNSAKSARASADVFKQSFNNTQQVTAALARQETKLASMSERARNLGSTIENSALGDPDKIKLADKVQAEINRMKALMQGSTPLDPAQFRRASLEYTKNLGNIRREYAHLKTEAQGGDLGLANQRKLREALQNLGSTMLLVNGHLGGMSTRFIALSTIVSNTGITIGIAAGTLAGLGIGLKAVATGAIQTELKLEKARLALTALTGSSAAASVEFEKVRQVSNDAGLAFEQVGASYSKYYAAARAAGQAGSAIDDQFRSTAMAAGTLGLTVEDTQGVFKAFEQMLSKGTVQAEELRGQLGDRFPGAFQIAADAMGVTTRALNKMMKEGDVLSSEFVPKFIEAMKKAYNIDMNAPIDTLQASINRGQNALTNFFDAFSKNTKFIEAAKRVLELFVRTLDYFSQNMASILQTIVGVTGAIVGVTAAWLAWHAVILATAGLTAFVSWMSAIIGLMRTAKTVTELLTLAQLALNTAMMSNPIGALLGLLAKLAVALGAGYYGYKLFTDAIDNNAASMDSSLTGIEQYIAQQKALGFQVAATTAEIRKQAIALAVKAGEDLKEKNRALKAARGGPSFMDAMNAKIMITGPDAGSIVSPTDVYRERLGAMVKETKEATLRAKGAVAAIKALDEVAALPEMNSSGVPAITGLEEGSKKAANAAEKAADKVNGLMQSYKTLMATTAAMSSGPEAIKMAEALLDAQQTVEGLDGHGVRLLDQALKQAGFSAGTLAERLAKMNFQVSEGEEKVANFVRAWEDIDNASADLRLLNDQINAFKFGGGAGASQFLEYMQDADKIVAGLSEGAIDTLIEKIQSLGIGMAVAATPADTLKLALTNLWEALDRGNEQKSILEDFQKDVDGLERESNRLALTLQGMGQGLSGAELDLWVDQTEQMGYWADTLRAAGVEGEALAEMLGKLGAAQQRYKDLTESLKLAEYWEDVANRVSSAIGDFAMEAITEFKGVGDALKNLMQRLFEMVVEMLIVIPLMNAVKSLLTGIGGSIGIPGLAQGGSVKGYAGGGFVSGGGTSTSDSVMARLSKGEFVMSADAVSKWGVNTMQSMNNGVAPAGRSGQNGPIKLEVNVSGAKGNAEIREMVNQGVGAALREYADVQTIKMQTDVRREF